MDSIARRVSIRGGLILVAALVLVGALTGVLLHTRAVRALDQALLAAAVGRAHPDVNAEVEFEPVHSPIRTWLIRHDDHRISAEVADRTREHDGPLYLDDGLDRLVLLPFEVEAGHQESKGVAAASARRVTLAASVGPFALIYAVLAGVVALGATLMHRNTVRRAFLPLDQTRRELASVVGLSESGLLTEVGPVEVRSLVVAINSLLLRLKSAHEAQARFTAEAAHECVPP